MQREILSITACVVSRCVQASRCAFEDRDLLLLRTSEVQTSTITSKKPLAGVYVFERTDWSCPRTIREITKLLTRASAVVPTGCNIINHGPMSPSAGHGCSARKRPLRCDPESGLLEYD
jgi:hypothetical protein